MGAINLSVKVTRKDIAPGLLRQLARSLQGAEARAGFLSGPGGHGADPVDGAPDIDMAGLAAVHELGATIQRGTTTIVLPERSFLRAALEAAKGELAGLLGRALKGVADGKIDPRRAFLLVGEEMKTKIQTYVRTNQVQPPDAPMTLARKEKKRADGNEGPVVTLIDSGQLVGAVTGDAVVPGAPGTS